jgi:large subunit ribosomal protein L20
MDGLKKSGIDLNRKILAEIAATDEAGFRALVDRSRSSASAPAVQ